MNNIETLDLLTLLSFILQVENQGRIIDIKDVQNEVNRAIEEIHAHLETQDEKMNEIIILLRELIEVVLKNEDNQETVRDDRGRD